ncbi:MAG TPA: EamA family transporter [Kofleriaceae bacterium]|nr:EamA family transporter [Kofleriaceae bacterium]
MTARRDAAVVAVAAASWGTWSLFLRPTGLPALTIAPIVFAVMGLVALPVALAAPRARWDRATLGLVALNAAFDAANVICFFAALAYTTVAIAVLTHYAAPILVALGAGPIDGNSPRGTRPAALVALAGLAIVLEPWHAPAAGALVGAALGLASAAAYAGNVFVVRRLAGRIGATRAMAYHALVAAAVLAPVAASGLRDVTPGALALLAAGGATIGAGAGIAFVTGLVRIGSARAAVLAYAEPLVAVGVGVAVWHEPLHAIAALGAALVIAAGIHVARQC